MLETEPRLEALTIFQYFQREKPGKYQDGQLRTLQRRVSYPDFSGIELSNGATVEYLKKRIDKLKANYDSKGIKENVERVLQDAEYDIIDIHLYDDPQNWPEYLSVLPEGKEVLFLNSATPILSLKIPVHTIRQREWKIISMP